MTGHGRGRLWHALGMKPTLAAVGLLLCLGTGGARAAEGTGAGDVAAIVLPAGAAAGTLLAHDHKGVAQLAESYASAMAVAYILKPTVDRTRPNGGHMSFPSGHATSAFAGAAFLQRRYGWWFGIPAYGLASYVAYSRVETKQHYTSDVVAGAAIGIATNLAFTHPREHVAVALDGGRGHAGCSVALAW
jgi:membrane-associated phospholipid phosphatase